MTEYLLISILFIWPFKFYTKYRIRKRKDEPEYIDAVSIFGEKNTFLIVWASSSILWPITLFNMTLSVFEKLSENKGA